MQNTIIIVPTQKELTKLFVDKMIRQGGVPASMVTFHKLTGFYFKENNIMYEYNLSAEEEVKIA